MKRLILSLLLLIALLVCGCQKNEYGLLDYQDKNIEAECIVNDKYKIVLKKEENRCVIMVKEPREAEGICFEIAENEVLAVVGETRIQMSKDDLKGIYALSGIFSQKEECLKSADKSGSGSVLTFETEMCNYAITLGENSMPKRVKINGEGFFYNVEICTIKLI